MQFRVRSWLRGPELKGRLLESPASGAIVRCSGDVPIAGERTFGGGDAAATERRVQSTLNNQPLSAAKLIAESRPPNLITAPHGRNFRDGCQAGADRAEASPRTVLSRRAAFGA